MSEMGLLVKPVTYLPVTVRLVGTRDADFLIDGSIA